MIRCKRVYLEASTDDGRRVLVDRLWPRGISKANLHIDAWLADVAPSNSLRKAFAHQPAAFERFCHDYRQELNAHPEHWQHLLQWAASSTLTLLYAARDERYNNARVLADFLEDELSRRDIPSSSVCYQGEYEQH